MPVEEKISEADPSGSQGRDNKSLAHNQMAAWWARLITDTPSDDHETGVMDLSSEIAQISLEDNNLSCVDCIDTVKHAIATKDRKITQRESEDDPTGKLLDKLLPDNICYYDVIESRAIESIGGNLGDRLKRIENATIEGMLDPEFGATATDSDESGSAGSSKSESSDDFFQDLEKEIPFLRNKVDCGSKQQATTKRSEKGHTNIPAPSVDANQTPLMANTSSQIRRVIAEECSEDEIQLDLAQNLPVLTVEVKDEHPSMQIDSTLSDDTVVVNSAIGTTTNISPPEAVSKICVPPIVKNRLGLLKKLKMNRSVSTASTSKQMSVESLPNVRFVQSSLFDTQSSCSGGGGGGGIYYIYDCESNNHSYVAYFRRGGRATECLRDFEITTPRKFPTIRNEVAVKIMMSTISGSDCAIRRGDWWGESSRSSLNLPIVPGTAFLGDVMQIDATANRCGLRNGDRVVSLVRVGANSRHLCIENDRLVKVPQGVHDLDAIACIPEIYLTAFQTIHMGQKNAARYRKTSLQGKYVLVLGGASALGQALIELSLAAGATAVYATAVEKHHSEIEKTGGVPLDRAPQNWLSILGGKMDVVVGADEPYTKPEFRYEHVQTLNKNGRLVLVTSPNQADTKILNLDELSDRVSGTNRKMHHYNVFDSWEADMKQGKRDLTHLLKLLAEKLIQPKVIEKVPLGKVAKVQEMLDSRRLNGFVLCEPWIKESKRESSGVSGPATSLLTSLGSGVDDSNMMQSNDSDSSEAGRGIIIDGMSNKGGSNGNGGIVVDTSTGQIGTMIRNDVNSGKDATTAITTTETSNVGIMGGITKSRSYVVGGSAVGGGTEIREHNNDMGIRGDSVGGSSKRRRGGGGVSIISSGSSGSGSGIGSSSSSSSGSGSGTSSNNNNSDNGSSTISSISGGGVGDGKVVLRTTATTIVPGSA